MLTWEPSASNLPSHDNRGVQPCSPAEFQHREMTLLQQILRDTREDVAKAKVARPLKDLQRKIKSIPKPLGFRQALTSSGFGVIAEIKRKSPSMADMNPASVDEAPEAYKENDFVKAVSILTDWKYFGM